MCDAVWIAAAVVLGGSILTAAAAFSPAMVKAGFAGLSVHAGKRQIAADIEFMAQLAENARTAGNAVFEEASCKVKDSFIRGALQLAAGGIDPVSLRSTLALRANVIEGSFGEAARFWQFFAAACAAWGMIGALAGLAISVSGIMHTDTGFYTAVCSASLGVFISQCMAMPAFARVNSKSAGYARRIGIITEGLMSIKEGDPPRLLQEKLKCAGGAGGGFLG